MEAVLDVSKGKYHELCDQISVQQEELPDSVWQKGIQNYNFCFNQVSQRLAKKLKKLSPLHHLDILLPHRNLDFLHPMQNDDDLQVTSAEREDEELISQEVIENSEQIIDRKIFFTPDMITPIHYDAENFIPSIADDISISPELSQLCSLAPSFSPTPPSTSPPNGSELHAAMINFKKRLSWAYIHRKKDLDECGSVEVFLQKEVEEFVKDPWYVPSTREPPPLPPALEFAFQSVYKKIMDPLNWSSYMPNLSVNLVNALREAKSLSSVNIGIYLQDKSARICFADLEKTNAKVDLVLADISRYLKLGVIDPAQDYQKEVANWYSKFKSSLVSCKQDVTSFLLPQKVATPHLRVLLKKHKPGCPVRLTFSSVGTVTRNLSTFLDNMYLKPSLPIISSRRLQDTKEAALFIETVNKHIWDNDIVEKPSIYALDVANFFPTVTEDLALPAIEKALKLLKIKRRECAAVLEGLKIVRRGSFFKWKDEYWSQISGCALGDVDSCSYTDIAMAHLLCSMIPAAEEALSTNMDLFKIFRDDGIGVTLDEEQKVLEILQFFNNFNNQLQWTIPECSVCSIPEIICPHYDHLDFLDTRITWRQVKKGFLEVVGK